MPTVLELDGFDELIAWIEKAPERVIPYAEQAMDLACQTIVGALKPYPPSTPANMPGRVNPKDPYGNLKGYYERGRGWWYPVVKRATLGPKVMKSLGSKFAGKRERGLYGIAGYKLRATSEQLGRSWTSEVIRETTAIEGRIGNNASYAKYVQGPAAGQSQRMRQIGWMNVDEALIETEEDINAAFIKAIDDLVVDFAKE